MPNWLSPPDRRRHGHQQKQRDGRREADRFLTISDIADILGMQPRTIRQKYLHPSDRPSLLPFHEVHGEELVSVEDFERFERACVRGPAPGA